ncbi:MAG TPA: D-alanyl-D-alanine carboxypeptidase/D-alanyl-D-alanine-endopeptidase [Streptosporangiaceae bacterium]|nr:D-alanyl-D-alanine carboxypeptidase/D-alanyl-D-alanine-endopeptidase [Streptosporangiaceae bacterium]
MVLALALLCLFTIGAGAEVAHLMPPRLALFQMPSISGTSRAAAVKALRSVSDPSDPGDPGDPGHRAGAERPPTAAAVTGELSALIGTGRLGQQVGALVVNYSTGHVLYALNPDTGFTPASTTKVATAVAAIHTLGPEARFTTAVRLAADGRGLVLVGGGDPTLAAGRYPASFYPQPASLVTLAARTARALRAKGISSVRLSYDNALFTGPTQALGWPALGSQDNYISSGNVAPITALEVDQGRLTSASLPQDADVSANPLARSMRPGHDAATAFARFLRKDEITVSNSPVQERPGHGDQGSIIAAVKSATLAQMAQWMLQESNNVIAETLARQVAIATGRPGTFTGAARAVMAVDAKLGVRGIHLYDGSGLSPLDLISPRALVKLVELAAGQRLPGLRAVITGLPVAGFSGTLGPGSFFGPFGPAALGTVRAKTGNITGVATMAGFAYARDGALLAFAFMGNGIDKKLGLQPESMLSELATTLAGCGCR